MMVKESTPQQADLASRLRGVRVGFRDDLDVSRHVFRGEVSYVLRDRLTFQSHRFNLEDYRILIHINAACSLGDIFHRLVESEVLEESDEARFYAFILQLHQQGLLSLPIADDKLLYRRFQARRNARMRQRTLGFLFLQVPLWDPSTFLDRTVRFVRPLLTQWFFYLWCALVLSAGVVCHLRAHELARPLDELLATRNLTVMWITLVLLKICHEFGHAYACRCFGGHVPEMGAFFIAGTPCAYVDATSSWGFSSKWRRIAVALAGMYIELMIAAIAVFVWAFSTDPMVRSIAYNIIFLAGATTILFNANPLMRYDGYYVFSDLVEIPNLRSRASKAALQWLKRWAIGLNTQRTDATGTLRSTLIAYGIAASAYRLTVFAGIATILAMKLPVVGLGLAALFLAAVIIKPVVGILRYAFFAEESAAVRVRAAIVGVSAVAVIPVAVLGIPIHWPTYASVIVDRESEVTVRTSTAAFLEDIHIQVGESVSVGTPIAYLSNTNLDQEAMEAEANLTSSRLRLAAFEAGEPWRAQRERSSIEPLQRAHSRYKALMTSLNVRASVNGTVVESLPKNDIGRFLDRGDPIATIAGGGIILRCLLDEGQFTAAQVRVGDRILFRPRSCPNRTFNAEVYRVEPAGSRHVDDFSSKQLGEHGIVVDKDGQASQPYFLIRARLCDANRRALDRGVTGLVRFESRAREPLGLHLYRSVARFISALKAR